ncbi:MAG: hypothetical protein AAFQ68_14435 [Bacteroidota bacterium]
MRFFRALFLWGCFAERVDEILTADRVRNPVCGGFDLAFREAAILSIRPASPNA